ncbi:UNVERIFIED_CONTAM: Haloalkane dehalogenase [Sesamum calycinum]|uniref:Haloalkane dehalogenase n=1 Tax=Sesamum calycinum TaxID=2727403 RepID=A0AAW2SB06_9LAMI
MAVCIFSASISLRKHHQPLISTLPTLPRKKIFLRTCRSSSEPNEDYFLDAPVSVGDGFSFSGGKYSDEPSPADEWFKQGKIVKAHPVGGTGEKAKDPIFGLAMAGSSQASTDLFRWFCVESGSATNPPVVLIHGFPSQAYSYRKVLPILSKNNHAIAFDWLGFGFSDKPQPKYGFDYTLKEYVESLESVISEFSKDKVTLVVQGYFAPVVVKYAKDHQEKLNNLILLNPPLTAKHANLPSTLSIFSNFLLGEIFSQDPLRASDKALTSCGPYKIKEDVAMVYRRPYLTSGSAGFALNAISRSMKKELKGFVEEMRRTLTDENWKVQTTVCWGQRDRWLSFEGVEDFCKESNLQLITLPTAGHHVQEDCSEEVGNLIAGIMVAVAMIEPKKKRSFMCGCLPSAILLSAVFFIGSAFFVTDYKENECRPDGTETLPRGIVSRTTDLEMRSLWGPPKKKLKSPMNLLAIAVGIKQKQNVNEIVKKFPLTDFAIMLFHYDGNVDGWRNLEWSNSVIHVSAINQTKWWFAKRFLHPDVVAQYDHIFLWDEDLGVENFHAGRYLSIIKEEGLQISQPAIDADKSEVHYKLTARETSSKVHRRAINLRGPGRRCYENSIEPPCTGFVEMMAPVFSRASWRCAWYMIQNDLVHAWGLDFQLGYCAQGNRTTNIGIVDSEYVIHLGLPTLGGSAGSKTNDEVGKQSSSNEKLPNAGKMVASKLEQSEDRNAVRKESFIELDNFKNRWRKAVRDDECWVDPFQQQPPKQS